LTRRRRDGRIEAGSPEPASTLFQARVLALQDERAVLDVPRSWEHARGTVLSSPRAAGDERVEDGMRHVVAAVLLSVVAVVSDATGGRAEGSRTILDHAVGSLREVHAPPAQWIVRENLRAGTSDWRIPRGTPRSIEGFANKVSAQAGDWVALFVSTAAATFRVKAFRMGWYGGTGARLVWSSDTIPGGVQRAPTVRGSAHLVEAPWRVSLRFRVTVDWPEGVYLLKLISGSGAQKFVPLTVRNDDSRAALVVQNEVTTWQAYNLWGGYSLYAGRSGSAAMRASIVSFDRPYAQNRGAAGILDGTERPLIVLVEKYGYDVTYWTDVDLHARPELLFHHRALVSLGHDEYWSSEMRDVALRARRFRGINLAFLGGNADYRHIRLAASPRGSFRREINYRIAALDPLYGTDNSEVTVNWRDPPIPRPESLLNGDFWRCFPATPARPMRIVSNVPWLFAGTGVHRGSVLPKLVLGETDRVDPAVPTPDSVQIIAHSPIPCGVTDVTYYTTSSGAGVFDSGTIGWMNAIKCDPPLARYACDRRILRATRNLLDAFAAGPAGRVNPSSPNLAQFGIRLRHPVRV